MMFYTTTYNGREVLRLDRTEDRDRGLVCGGVQDAGGRQSPCRFGKLDPSQSTPARTSKSELRVHATIAPPPTGTPEAPCPAW
jgi:hypothetical protein